MKVSICCITYNHGRFIKNAIESFFLQKVNFELEIIISDDASTDETVSIIESLVTSFPNKIKLYTQPENIGMMPNFLFALKACTGKYISFCEGDDFWTDPYKLQKQIDFLEKNNDYVMCFHNVYELHANRHITLSTLNNSSVEKTYKLEDLALGNIIHTPSVVIRNNKINEYPEWFTRSAVGDYVIYMLIAQYGLIKFMPEPMATYRRHDKSAWSSLLYEKAIFKFMGVIDLLLSEPFSESVIKNLIIHKRNLANRYLNILLNKNDPSFLEQLEELSSNDELLAKEWLLTHYPLYIKQLQSARSYKLAKRLAFLRYKLFRGFLLF